MMLHQDAACNMHEMNGLCMHETFRSISLSIFVCYNPGFFLFHILHTQSLRFVKGDQSL